MQTCEPILLKGESNNGDFRGVSGGVFFESVFKETLDQQEGNLQTENKRFSRLSLAYSSVIARFE